jgi:hypothetical protein
MHLSFVFVPLSAALPASTTVTEITIIIAINIATIFFIFSFFHPPNLFTF